MDGSQCKRIRLTASNQITTIYENSFQTILSSSVGEDVTREIDEKIKQLYSGLGEKFKKEDVVAIIIEVMMEYFFRCGSDLCYMFYGQHTGPVIGKMTAFVDWIFLLISSPEDTKLMQMKQDIKDTICSFECSTWIKSPHVQLCSTPIYISADGGSWGVRVNSDSVDLVSYEQLQDDQFVVATDASMRSDLCPSYEISDGSDYEFDDEPAMVWLGAMMVQCLADRESTEMYVKSKSRDTLRVIGERAHEFLESGEGSEFERILTMLMKVSLPFRQGDPKELIEKRPSCVFGSGASGTGKTTLLQELIWSFLETTEFGGEQGSFPLAYVCSLLEGTRVLKFEDSQVCLDEFSKMLGGKQTFLDLLRGMTRRPIMTSVNKFAKSATDVYVRKNFTIIGTTNKRPTTDAENGFFGVRNSKTQGVDQDAAARSIAFIDFKGRPKDEVMDWNHVPRGAKDGALVLLYILQKTSEFAADFNWQRLATVLGKDDNDDPDELEWNAWPEFLAAFGLVEGETRRVRKDKMLQKYDEFKESHGDHTDLLPIHLNQLFPSHIKEVNQGKPKSVLACVSCQVLNHAPKGCFPVFDHLPTCAGGNIQTVRKCVYLGFGFRR